MRSLHDIKVWGDRFDEIYENCVWQTHVGHCYECMIIIRRLFHVMQSRKWHTLPPQTIIHLFIFWGQNLGKVHQKERKKERKRSHGTYQCWSGTIPMTDVRHRLIHKWLCLKELKFYCFLLKCLELKPCSPCFFSIFICCTKSGNQHKRIKPNLAIFISRKSRNLITCCWTLEPIN
jgi:hypothetical protein